MASSIAILEGNCYLHSGEAQWSKNMQMLGFPTGGIYQLMSKICNLQTRGIPYVVVFDSPSFRKSVNMNYKKSRKVDYKILAQANALIPLLRNAGVSVLQVPEFEGDDLVANIIAANPNYQFTIYTCDYDIAINVSKRVSVCGCKSGFPAINAQNFSSIMSREAGTEIPYNLIGVHKAIYGCKSDEIQNVGPEADALWNMFLAIWRRDYDSKDKVLLASSSYCEKFINAVESRFSNPTVQKFRENIVLVFPRMLTEKELQDNGINLTDFGNVSDTDLTDVCHIFGLKKCYRMLTNDFDEYELTEKERMWILRRAKDYKYRTDAVNAEVDINAEARFNDGGSKDSEEEDSNSGYSLAANGLNIGLL